MTIQGKSAQRLSTGLTVTVGLLVASAAWAGPRDVAARLFNRVNGVPPSAAKLDELAALVDAGDARAAALAAIDDTGGMFYNLTLKNLVARWSNADKSPRVPLNDYVATVIGMTRDDVPFDQVLSGDIVYTGTVTGAPVYSLANNDHYAFLETQGAPLHTVLAKQTQSALSPSLPADATAGVLTTRAFGEAYYKAGTNRRAVAFSLSTFLCRELDQLHDTTRADMRVRRDVTRAPGGDSSLFRNRCAGCHAGMDAFGGAFAYYDFSDAGALVFTPGQVGAKFNRNVTEFPDGYVTVDDSWINMWMEGQNANVGWSGAASGNGVKEFGEMLAATDAFSSCMAQRAVEAMCLRSASSDADKAAVGEIAATFKNGHNLKGAFADAAVYCTE